MQNPAFPTGRRPGRRLPLVLAAFALGVSPIDGLAQAPAQSPPQRLRTIGELQLLGGQADGELTPSLRLTLQRRRSLGTAFTVSGLFLQDHLSHTGGIALGYGLSVPMGPLALEPFAELGAGLTDARVGTGSYSIVDPGGSVRTVERYRAVEGTALLTGGGLSLSGVVGGSTAARLTVGYWQVTGSEGLNRGGLRFGLSLGLGRRDQRWYALATDRTAPVLAVLGVSAEGADSIALVDGAVTVLSSDTNGIARIQVNGRDVELRPADRFALERSGLPGGSVAARLPVEAPFGGRALELTARDSAGLETSVPVRVFGPPDREPPVLTLLEPTAQAGVPPWPFQVLATDYSGIADARLGVCSVAISYPNPMSAGEGLSSTARVLGGWEALGSAGPLIVTDRSGNQARLQVSGTEPSIAGGAQAPELRVTSPLAGTGRGGTLSVLVRGSVNDPAGGWIRQVTVAGLSAPLRYHVSPGLVEFEGWLSIPDTATTLEVEATTLDGRSARETIGVAPRGSAAEGKLHVIVARPSADGHDVWERIADLADAADRDVLLGADATAARLVDALVRAQGRAQASDVVLVHVTGTLAADSTSAGPSIVLSGGEIRGDYLARLLRALEPAATLLAGRATPGSSWQTPLATPLGAPIGAGCLESTALPAGRAVNIGDAPAARLLDALAGGADRDADGAVRVGELLDFLGAAPSAGLTSHRPDAVVVGSGGAR